MNKTLDSKELRTVQISLLKYVQKVCEENNLRYFLSYGTLLGAIRHKGYIPWDDDIDVMMPRKDYMALIKLVHQSQFQNFRILSIYNNSDYFAPFAKVVDTRTLLIQKYDQVEKVELGVNIDIFPLDGLPSEINSSKKHFKRIYLLRYMWALSIRKITAKNRTKLNSFLLTIASIPFRIIGYRFFVKKLENLAMKFDFESSEYIGCLSFGEGEKERIKRTAFEEIEKIRFEDKYYNCPKGWHQYLLNIYGTDYMNLPPVSERKRHKFEAFWK